MVIMEEIRGEVVFLHLTALTGTLSELCISAWSSLGLSGCLAEACMKRKKCQVPLQLGTVMSLWIATLFDAIPSKSWCSAFFFFFYVGVGSFRQAQLLYFKPAPTKCHTAGLPAWCQRA